MEGKWLWAGILRRPPSSMTAGKTLNGLSCRWSWKNQIFKRDRSPGRVKCWKWRGGRSREKQFNSTIVVINAA